MKQLFAILIFRETTGRVFVRFNNERHFHLLERDGREGGQRAFKQVERICSENEGEQYGHQTDLGF
jgi:hypothetical protein